MVLALACVWNCFDTGVIQTDVFEEDAFLESSCFSELLPERTFLHVGTSESALPF